MARRPVIALARGSDGVSAGERVVAAVGGVRRGARLEVVEGDLTAPGCDLAPSDRRRLRATVETVIHCAGDTTFAPAAMAPYVAGHVDGPSVLLEGLAGGRLRRWAHLSTAYVCGRRSGTILERDGDVGQAFNNDYERVKLESERVLRAAGVRLGVDVRVFRPSIVVGAAPPTAGGNPSNLFFGFIRMVAALAQMPDGADVRLRIEAAPRARFNIVPVEYVAAAVCALAERPGGAGETFHLVVRDAPTQAAMLRTITERLGVRGLALADARTEPLADPSSFERSVARMLEPYRAYLTQDLTFDDATTARLLRGCAVERPTLSADAVHQLIDLALLTEDARLPAAR
jgi:thioester reductase-like protein